MLHPFFPAPVPGMVDRQVSSRKCAYTQFNVPSRIRKVNENRVGALQKNFMLNEPLSLLKLTVSQDKGACLFSLP